MKLTIISRQIKTYARQVLDTKTMTNPKIATPQVHKDKEELISELGRVIDLRA